jgi:hypothetical protein
MLKRHVCVCPEPFILKDLKIPKYSEELMALLVRALLFQV